MKKQWMSEKDMEVTVFHPVCARALQEALEMLKLSDTYQIEHHRYVGSLEMDLVISNINTRKILCVVEVKRTIQAVYSTRYQYQAMSYVQSLRDTEKESNYYILTNLECSCLFLYSTQRQNTYDQLIQPGYIFNHRFSEVDEITFRNDLALHYKNILSKILKGDVNYSLSFSNFAEIVKDSLPSNIQWNSSIAFMFYEYIRGSFNGIGRNDLYDIRLYRDNIIAICREALRINFKGIFGFNSSEYDKSFKPKELVLSNLYDLGQNYIDADYLCNIMHQVIANGHSHDGEVPTDIELAQTLMCLVKSFIPEIPNGYNITDPAAGSGTLLSAVTYVFPTLQPSQICANDINPHLLQLLSLRMGLNFASTINKNNSPIVSTENICKLDPSFFTKTKVIVLNPPYLSAVSKGCVDRKIEIAKRIKELTGNDSITNIGQAPLECLFIELVVNLVPTGTIIACIIPNTHLSALGNSDVAFRQYLIRDFGLSMIFNYPQTNLFEDVVQNTSIFIGKSFEPQEKVKFIQSLSLISELELDTLENGISLIKDADAPEQLANGIVGYLVPKKILEEKVFDGWKFLDSTMGDVYSFVNDHVINNSQLFANIAIANYGDMQRGKVGNAGGNDLIYITTKPQFLNECCAEIKKSLKPGLRNSDYGNFLVGNGDQQFFDITGIDESIVKDAISVYLDKYETQQRQSKKKKSVDEWYNILKKEVRHFVPTNSVLLPRGTRRLASTYITTAPTYLSTNLVYIQTPNFTQAKILASWMCSLFYQLQLELFCKNQGGMRKLEIENINKTFVPRIDSLTTEEIRTIIATEINDFYDLKNPCIREVDKVWAKIIIKNDDVDDLLNEAVRFLTILAINRES